MSKLSKKQKELLIFAATNWAGLISVNSNDAINNTAYQLTQKGLMERRDTKLPFCGGVSYWILTKDGWDIAYTLE